MQMRGGRAAAKKYVDTVTENNEGGGEDDADDVDSVSLFLCLLKENRLTRTSGFGDNTGGLLILASENFNS